VLKRSLKRVTTFSLEFNDYVETETVTNWPLRGSVSALLRKQERKRDRETV